MKKVKLLNTNTTKLHKNREEHWGVINIISGLLKRKRGWVAKMPKRGSPVVACMSGGLDSTANIAMLLEEFGYEVYPYFINRNQSSLKYEKKSVDWYNNYFKKRYKNYHQVQEINIEIPSHSYKPMLRATKHLQDDLKLRERNTYPARNPMMIMTGMEYGYSLQSKGIFVKALFVAQHSDDLSVHGSLTLLRILSLMSNWLLKDWGFQILSIPIEKEFGNFYGKDVSVKWCHEHGIPLERTRSCCNNTELQCGICNMACWKRRMAFKTAGVVDKTKYENPMPECYEKTKNDNKENWNGRGQYNK